MAKKLNIKPMGGRLLVKPTEEPQKTKGGLYIPDTAEKEKPQEGEVVALGTGKINEDGKVLPFSVEVGDKVLFKKYAPDEIEINEEKYLVLNEDDVLAVLK